MRTYSFLPVLMLALHAHLAMAILLEAPCPLAACIPPEPNNPCKDQCQRDRQCGPGGKCCPLCGCNVCIGGTPVSPPLSKKTCATKQCPSGKVCVERRKRSVCVRQPVEKPGLCPIAAMRCAIPVNPICPDRQCDRDSQCPRAQKCCSNCSGCRSCDNTISG